MVEKIGYFERLSSPCCFDRNSKGGEFPLHIHEVNPSKCLHTETSVEISLKNL